MLLQPYENAVYGTIMTLPKMLLRRCQRQYNKQDKEAARARSSFSSCRKNLNDTLFISRANQGSDKLYHDERFIK